MVVAVGPARMWALPDRDVSALLQLDISFSIRLLSPMRSLTSKINLFQYLSLAYFIYLFCMCMHVVCVCEREFECT